MSAASSDGTVSKPGKSYQSFDGVTGSSDSPKKLEALRLPADLTGKRVLDIGCNEGFFCFEASNRGASEVVGLDYSERYIALAEKRNAEFPGNVKFLCQDAQTLPEGPFDLVLILSVLHYFDDPIELMEKVHRILAPDGTLVLECGVLPDSKRTLVRALRSIDDRYFPSRGMLENVWLKNFASRSISASVNQAGDPVPRSVYHCTPLRTNILMLHGIGGTGKSNLIRNFDSAIQINTDHVLKPLMAERVKVNPHQQALDKALEANNRHLLKAWRQVAADPEALDYFADVVARSVRLCRGEPLVVLEGAILASIRDRLQRLLEPEFRIWDASRGEFPGA